MFEFFFWVFEDIYSVLESFIIGISSTKLYIYMSSAYRQKSKMVPKISTPPCTHTFSQLFNQILT